MNISIYKFKNGWSPPWDSVYDTDLVTDSSRQTNKFLVSVEWRTSFTGWPLFTAWIFNQRDHSQHTRNSIHIQLLIHVRIHIHIHTHTCTHMYAYKYIYLCMRTFIYIHIYIHTYIHTYKQTYLHTHTHTHTHK